MTIFSRTTDERQKQLWWDFFFQNMDLSDYHLFAQQMEKKHIRNGCLSSCEDMKHYYRLKWFQVPVDGPFSSSSIAGQELNRERLAKITCFADVVSFFDASIFFSKSQQDTNGNWVPKCLCKSKWNCKWKLMGSILKYACLKISLTSHSNINVWRENWGCGIFRVQ